MGRSLIENSKFMFPHSWGPLLLLLLEFYESVKETRRLEVSGLLISGT
jgi:hypothetical protein